MNVKTLSLRSLQVHLKVAIVALCMAAALFAMPHPAQADGLTEPQIQAVLGLLSAFDVPQATIQNVSNILHGTVTQTTTPSCVLDATRNASTGLVTFSWTTQNANSFSIYPAPGSMFMSPVASGSLTYGNSGN